MSVKEGGLAPSRDRRGADTPPAHCCCVCETSRKTCACPQCCLKLLVAERKALQLLQEQRHELAGRLAAVLQARVSHGSVSRGE